MKAVFLDIATLGTDFSGATITRLILKTYGYNTPELSKKTTYNKKTLHIN